MTALEWDKTGDRRYETGIDHGVLYLSNGEAVVWNGLTSVVESRAREVKSFYLDGVKYLDHQIPGTYSAKLQAITYPDQLDILLGNPEFAPGVTLYDQKSSIFNLSYRTLVGNDILGVDYGYKLHLIYNAMAMQSEAGFDTLAGTVATKPFEWDLMAVPDKVSGMRPTSHISVDSNKVDPVKLESLEALLYGTEDKDPMWPPLVDLLAMLETP